MTGEREQQSVERQTNSAPHGKDIDQIFEEGTAIDEAISAGVRDALLFHKRMGNPIATWRDGKVVWIPPEEIEVDEQTPSGDE